MLYVNVLAKLYEREELIYVYIYIYIIYFLLMVKLLCFGKFLELHLFGLRATLNDTQLVNSLKKNLQLM